MIYLFWVAVLGAMALGLAAAFDRKIEETFAPAVFLAVLVLYVPGLFGPLKAGLWLVAALGAAGAGYAAVRMVQKRACLCATGSHRADRPCGAGALHRLDAGGAHVH